MLNSLASYFLGYPATAEVPSSSAAATPVISAQVPSTSSGADAQLFTKEADDDWLLIDKSDEPSEAEASPRGASSMGSGAVPIPGASVRLNVTVSAYHWAGDADDLSGTGTANAGAPSMEESWFVTPPPCFTSGSVPLETSPLENLLIEHPSMSVYHRSPVPVATPTLSSSVGAVVSPQRPAAATPAFRRGVQKYARAKAVASQPPRLAAASTPASGAKAAEACAEEPRPAGLRRPRVEPRPSTTSPTRGSAAQTPPATTGAVHASPRRPNAFSPYQQQQQQQLLQVRSAQKLVQRAACQLMKRDALERTNKAREILSSRNKRQRRSDRMRNHSGANNNRKC